MAKEGASQNDLPSLLAAGRRQVQLDGAAKRKEQKAQEDAVKAFVGGVGQEHVKTLLSSLPGLASLVKESIHPLPVADSFAFWLPAVESETTCHAIGVASATRASNLNMSLEQEWRETHGTIRETMCAPLPAQQPIPSKCQKLGYCICGAQGKTKLRLRNKLLGLFKKKFPGKTEKQKLVKADVVLLLKATIEPNLEMEEPMTISFWYHIAAMSLSPYEPTMHNLEHCPHLSETRGPQDRCVLKAIADVKG